MIVEVYHPQYLRVFKRDGYRTWSVHDPQPPQCVPVLPGAVSIPTLADALHYYELREAQVIAALERFAVQQPPGAQDGYYLADLRSLDCYYCGPLPQHVKTKLQQLGIGAA